MRSPVITCLFAIWLLATHAHASHAPAQAHALDQHSGSHHNSPFNEGHAPRHHKRGSCRAHKAAHGAGADYKPHSHKKHGGKQGSAGGGGNGAHHWPAPTRAVVGKGTHLPGHKVPHWTAPAALSSAIQSCWPGQNEPRPTVVVSDGSSSIVMGGGHLSTTRSSATETATVTASPSASVSKSSSASGNKSSSTSQASSTKTGSSSSSSNSAKTGSQSTTASQTTSTKSSSSSTASSTSKSSSGTSSTATKTGTTTSSTSTSSSSSNSKVTSTSSTSSKTSSTTTSSSSTSTKPARPTYSGKPGSQACRSGTYDFRKITKDAFVEIGNDVNTPAGQSADFINQSGSSTTWKLTSAGLEVMLPRPQGAQQIFSSTVQTSFLLQLNSRVSWRMKVSDVKGTVTSATMYGGQGSDEIDIELPASNYQTNIFGKGVSGPNSAWHSTDLLGDKTAGAVHEYSFTWTKEYIEWTFDGKVQVRKLAKDLNGAYPLGGSPLAFGIWQPNTPGSIAWAGGPLDWSKYAVGQGPTALFESMTVECNL